MDQIKNKNKLPFVVLGVLAALAGVFLTFEKKYMLGISSIIVGVGLSIRSYKEYKNRQE